MITFARPSKAKPTECARPISFSISEPEYWQLKVVTELLGEPQYEFLNRIVSDAVRGHMNLAQRSKSLRPELSAATKNVAKKQAVRRKRAKRGDAILNLVRDQVKLEDRAERIALCRSKA